MSIIEGFVSEKTNGLLETLKKTKVVVFGAGSRGQYCASCLSQMDVTVYAYFDNNSSLWGKQCNGVAVLKPEYIPGACLVLSVKGKEWDLALQAIQLGYAIDKLCTYDNVVRVLSEKNEPIHEYPHTIQLPITHLCNFDCVMCGMHSMINRKDFSHAELGKILEDDYYKKIKSVGINGGEPFLKEDLVECVEVLCDKLPMLEDLFFISNGYLTENILTKLRRIKEICSNRNVNVHLSLSVDGVGKVQDMHRGKGGSFEAVNNTLNRIKESMKSYVDTLDAICTITKHNIYNIYEVETWEKESGITVEYNIASENVRIENEDRVNSFSLFSDKQAQMLASEFFYSKYVETGKEKYFGLYLFLSRGRRYTQCPCRTNEWITITPDSQIGFCATHSPKLGDGFTDSTSEIVRKNMNVLTMIRDNYCKKCAHYGYRLNGDGFVELFRDDLLNSHFHRGINDK